MVQLIKRVGSKKKEPKNAILSQGLTFLGFSQNKYFSTLNFYKFMKFSTENEKKESFVETLKRLSGLGKPHHEIHKPNPYQQARKETGFTRPYANAELKLAPKTFSEQWNGTKNLVVAIRDVYPYLSVASAIMVGYMVGKLFVTGFAGFSYWLIIGFITAIVFAVAAINEKLKKDTAEKCFALQFGQSDVPKDQHETPPYAKLILFLGISIAISSYGGNEISLIMGDKSTQIDSTYTAQIDSIKAIYLPQIALYDSQITKLQSNDFSTYRPKTKRKLEAQNDWRITEKQKSKEALDSRLDAELKSLKSEGKSEVLKQGSENKNLALYAAIIVGIFEILYIISFAFEYWVYAGQKEETRNFNLLPQTFYTQHFSQVPTIYINQQGQTNKNLGQTAGFSFGISNHYKGLNPSGSCHTCGKNIENMRSDALFCSKKCSNIFHNPK